MRFATEFSDIVENIYGAASNTRLYDVVASQISDYIGADGAILILHDTKTQHLLSASMVHYDHLPIDSIFEDYGRHWHRDNPQVIFEQMRRDQGIYYEGCDPVLNCENHRDFRLWREQELGIKSQMTAYCRPSDRVTYAFAFSSHGAYAPEDPTQIARFALLAKHLRQSVALAYRIGTLEGECAALLNHLDALAGPAMVLDGQGKSLFINDNMSALIGQHGGLRHENGRLCATRPHTERMLQHLISAALAQPPSAGALPVTGVQKGDVRLVLQVAPLAGQFRGLGIADGRILITISNWMRPADEAHTRFRASFGFTNAQATVAVHLMRGHADDDIARDLGIAVSTVRTHVRAILDKTQLRSKAELAHLLTALAR